MLDDIKALLPPSLQSDDIVLMMLGAILLLIILGAYAVMSGRDNMSSRVRNIQERHRAMRSQAPVAKQRKKPEASVNFIRKVVNSLQLIKKNQIGKTEALLIQAGFHSRDASISCCRLCCARRVFSLCRHLAQSPVHAGICLIMYGRCWVPISA